MGQDWCNIAQPALLKYLDCFIQIIKGQPMRRLLLLALSLPVFALAQSAPTFNAPTIPAAASDNPEKSVAKKEVEVAKREVSAASAEGKPSVAVPFGQRFIPMAAEQKSQTIKTYAQKAQMKVDGNPSDSESKTVAKP